MSDLHYKLIVDMETRGTLAPQLEKVGKSGGDLSKVKDTLTSIGSSVGSMASGMATAFTGAVEAVGSIAVGMAKVGAVGAGGAIAYGVTVLNNELEKAQVSLATIFSVQGQSAGMVGGLKDASAVMKDMRKDAADLPGEFKDLMGFFRMSATPGFQAGGSIKQIEKLSANAMATAAAQQVPMDQAARELAMLLQGRAGAHNVFGSLLGFTGDKAQTFNKSSGKERLSSVEKELEKYQPSRDVFSSTFDAMSGTLIDNGKKFLGAATSGVFDRVKGALESANKWFDANEERVLAFAQKVDERLSYAFEVGRRKIGEWAPSVIAFAENAYTRVSSIWERVAPMIEKVGEILKKALSDPATFDKIESILKLYAAVKIGGIVMPAVGGMASSALGAGAEAGMGAGALVGSAAVAGIALAGLGVAIYGAVDILSDSTKPLHAFATEQVAGIKDEFEELRKTIGRSDGAFVKFSDNLGAAALATAHYSGKVLNFAAQFVEFWATKESKRLGAVEAKLAADDEKERVKYDPTAPDAGLDRYANLAMPKLLSIANKEDEVKKPAKGVAGGGGTSIQKVEIVVSSNQDPSRIARAVMDEMKDVSRNPTSSRFVRNWGAVRP